MIEVEYQQKTHQLIDELKATCATYGLGNDGNEFKIITQVFLYKFLNDKFAYEVKKENEQLAQAENWEVEFGKMSADDIEDLYLDISETTAKLKPEYLISYLFSRNNEDGFAELFDDTLTNIATENNDIFAIKTDSGAKVVLFERIVSQYITDPSKRDNFARAIINKLVNFSFEHIFEQKFDFYANIFEYLIKDYNKDSGGKYAEYYTPHAVARIMASILVPKNADISNVTIYDPSAGSGSLLMNVAHAIGEDKCSIYTQDISQKSSHLLRLNLILNNLVASIPNVAQGNTILNPVHKDKDNHLKQFDYIVSNPPFKMDFSDFRDSLDTKANSERFFAGIPKISPKSKDKMAIYQLFLQHIIFSLKATGKASIVVPTGFITAQSGIDKKIRQKMIDDKLLSGVVSMPSNILGKNQKTVLSKEEEQLIIDTFYNKKSVDDLAVSVSYEDIQAKNYSLSAGQYFEVKIEYVDISEEDFNHKIDGFKASLDKLFSQSQALEVEIKKNLEGLGYE